MALTWLALVLLCLQASDRGRPTACAQPREVTRVHWELLQTAEVLVCFVPIDPDGKPVRINLTFHAFFPDAPERVGSAVQWPKGPPARLAVSAQAFPLTFVIPELSLRFVIDGTTVDLTASGRRHRNIPCPIATGDCTPTGVEADLTPVILRSLTTASSVRGEALGFPIMLTAADQAVLADFAARIGLSFDRHGLAVCRLPVPLFPVVPVPSSDD